VQYVILNTAYSDVDGTMDLLEWIIWLIFVYIVSLMAPLMMKLCFRAVTSTFCCAIAPVCIICYVCVCFPIVLCWTVSEYMLCLYTYYHYLLLFKCVCVLYYNLIFCAQIYTLRRLHQFVVDNKF